MRVIEEIDFMVKRAARTFTMKPGQSLAHIAKTYDTDVRQILLANPGVKDTAFRAGKPYNLPGLAPSVALHEKIPAKPVKQLVSKPALETLRVGGSSGAQSTAWESRPAEEPSYHRYGVAHTCADCGRKFYKPNPKWSPWEIRHFNKEQKKMIDLHNRLMHKRDAVSSSGNGATKRAAADVGVLGNLKNWLSYVKRDMGVNLLTSSELAGSAAKGAVFTALAGAGIGALIGKKKNRRRNAIRGAIMGAVAGGLGGPAYAQFRKYLDGIPFDNSNFDPSKLNKGDKVYIAVAGSANGEGHSWFMNSMKKRDFKGRVYGLRHVDQKELERVYEDLKSKGLNVTLIGHSSGGATVARFLRDHPESNGVLLDPVSWTGRNVPPNAVVFTAHKDTRYHPDFENVVANMGGRWNYEGDNSVAYHGGHSSNKLLVDFIHPLMASGINEGTNPMDMLEEWKEEAKKWTHFAK